MFPWAPRCCRAHDGQLYFSSEIKGLMGDTCSHSEVLQGFLLIIAPFLVKKLTTGCVFLILDKPMA